MNLEEARVKHSQLSKIIRQHDEKYYQEDAPEISDADYDDLRKELIALEKKYPNFFGC